ncbi:expressed unknown protein [Seminavis robusta]|uniref:Uncharacterized protein n=1 Tax=Seminavis robusta TaxID=568900 RepID=A0A9N8DPZ0_9STRA|nr:expressed unknown protein [Seminavis robusta]|eukprot:Sro256_g100520.1 n/a (569) ;mRNA; f:2190-4340
MANRKTSGQIQSLSQPLYTSAGNLREQIGQQAVAIAKLYRHIYDETTQKSRGDVMTFPRNYQDWEFKNILSESAFNYFQADEAIRMIQFGLDGRTPNYQPKGGFLSSCKRYLYDAIGLGLSEAGYLPDRSDGCIQDDEVEEAAENAMDQLIKPYLNLFKAVQKGYDLVFGDKTSMGFLCGMSEIIKKKGYSKWPGTCCLSAPFENVDGTWGRNHDCNTQCQVPGPVLAGLSEESCSANGGTWCPRPADCRILQECLQSAYDDAEANGKLAFALYLEPGLVEDPLNFGNCSHSREYFGYDELYTNGEDVCENVLQLHNNENFAFLDEFFNQGSGVTSGCGGNVEFEALKPPDRSRSESTGVQTGEKWEKADFSMNVIMDTTEALMEAAAAIKCPDDVTGAAQTSCAAMLNVYYPVIQIVYTAIRATFAISAFTRENLAEESYEEAMVSVEDISAVYDNMEAMNGNLEKLYNGLNTEIQTQCGSRRRQLADLSGADDELDVGAELLALKRQNEAMASEASALNSKLDDVNSKLDMQQKQMTLLQNMLQDVMIAVKKGEGVTPEAEARVSY